MSTKVGMISWFTNTLDSVNAILLEHRMSLQQLHDDMGQESYAVKLRLNAVMAIRSVLDEAYAALGDAFSRLTAAHLLTDTTNLLVAPSGGKVRGAPHIADAIDHVQIAQQSMKSVNARVRAMAALFTSERTRVVLVGGEVVIIRGQLAEILVRWNSAQQSILNARAQF